MDHNGVTAIVLALIAATPGILLGAAAWRAAHGTRKDLHIHTLDEDANGELILSFLEHLAGRSRDEIDAGHTGGGPHGTEE
jgi:hypothetical protein